MGTATAATATSLTTYMSARILINEHFNNNDENDDNKHNNDYTDAAEFITILRY